MSSRVLRKLHSDQGIPAPGLDSQESDPEIESISEVRLHTRVGKVNVNPFDLLNQNSPSESEVKEDDDRETEAMPSYAGANDDAESSKRKKKKKKKKPVRTGGGGSGGGSSSSNNKRSSEDNLEADEVERSVREVNQLLGDGAHHHHHHHPHGRGSDGRASAGSGPEKGLLKVEHKHLNPENEMKRIFGSRVVQSEIMKRRGRGRGSTFRNLWLVYPKPVWPQVGKAGITMKFLETRNGLHYFAFEHSVNYQEVQMHFLDAVESYNPDNILGILHVHPYHVDALLQLSDLCKMGEDPQMAVELVERALYSLETSFHPLFNLGAGNCRLDYRRQENRALFVAIFRYLSFLGQKACHRTSLEFCKLLLSLDPEGDPLGVTLMVDFYAVRAQQYKWLIRFYEELDSQRNLSQLPNFAFSVALAHFFLAQQRLGEEKEKGKENEEEEEEEEERKREDSTSGGNLMEKADEALQRALLDFPALLMPLLNKASIQPGSRTASHPFFNHQAQASTPGALQNLIQLYVGRAHHVWRDPQILPWLESNTLQVLDKVEAGDKAVAEAHEKRQRRYQGMPRNVHRHILMSEVKDATASLPPDLARTAVLSFDPLPPPDSINSYSRTPQPRPPSGSHQDGSSNLISIFLRSILPSFNAGRPLNYQLPNDHQGPPPNQLDVQLPLEEAGGAAGGAAEGGAGGGADLRRSVTSLLDAMRDLLSNINVPDLPQDADDDDTDQGEN